ncbi:restriction endonuclease subunit S [Veillonella parvula]|uniref:restriction endonuclease subunit S n=1 Tax=Veillonella parvula TaxID=29466 RepID=UPI0011EA573B|nr:restriction endonuclease subunit S [Veillonella parvula]
MMNTNKKTPKLRFKGFTDDWEQCKLGEIFEYLQNNTLSRDSLNYKIPNIKNIHYGDILVKFNEILDGSNNDIPYINPDLDLSKFSKSLLRDGDVIFSDTAEDDTVGKAIELQNVNAPFILSGLHTIPCRPLIPFGKGYLGNFFNSNSYRLQIRPLVQGIKVSSISKSALKDTMIKYPKNLDEQEKIGNLFQSITKMITLHQCKLEKLKLNKSALLQKLFPQNGCTIPEIRFKEFTGAWEQRKFSDLYEKISEKNDLSYSLDKIISVANMYYKSDAKVSNEEYLKTYNIFRYGEIAFEGNKSKDFAYGRFVENTIGDGIISHVFEVFRPIAKYDIYFWKYYINYEPIMGKILSRCTKKTTMMTNLVAKDFLKETVLVPTLAEQKQIGTLLNAIDKFITLHQRKLDRLISIKKGLLQQLFV